MENKTKTTRKKTLARRIGTALLAAGLMFGTGEVTAQNITEITPKVSGIITRVEKDRGKGTNRAELMIEDLPLNISTYTLAEEYGGDYFHKSRLQTVPLQGKNLGVGAAIQYKSSSLFEPYTQLGAVAELKGNVTKDVFGKIAVQYFPSEKELEYYCFTDSESIFADLVGSHNLETKTTMWIPGVDYKLNKYIFLGLEATVTGIEDKFTDNYVGGRIKFNFSTK